MTKTTALLCAAVLAGGVSVGFSAETTGTQSMSKTSGEEKATTGPASRTARMKEAYKAVGISDEKIAKLEELDKKAREAREKGEPVDRAAMREERQKVLTPEENEKVMKYLQEHGGGMGGGMRGRGAGGPGAGATDDKKPANP